MADKTPYQTYLAEVFGEDLEKFMHHPPVSDFIRVNTLRTSVEEVRRILSDYGFETEVACRDTGAIRILKAPHDPTLCLHHYAGFFVKQGLSSQIPPYLLAPQPGETVLDMCAAPGSKTTQIASMMCQKGKLYANDLSAKRMIPLAARLDGTRVSNTILLNHPGERLTQWMAPMFDRILADVPCSGLGVSDSLNENQYRYEKCKSRVSFYELQYKLLLSACKMLKVGGRVVYSTCSLNPSEDECVVDDIVSRLPMKILPVPDMDGIRLSPGKISWMDRRFDPSLSLTRRVVPWENDTRGFYVAVLEKQAELPQRHHYEPELTESRPTLPPDDEDVQDILNNIEYYYGIPKKLFDHHRFLINSRAAFLLDESWTHSLPSVYRAGLCLAKRRGRMWRLSTACIQKFSPYISKNKLTVNEAQMREMATTGWLKGLNFEPESPYPVLEYPPLGCLASTYAYDEGIYWKRPTQFYLPGKEN